jgi:cystathionine beta-lyase
MPAEIPNPLETLTLAQLRERTSMKWRAYEPDVLPLWVAEMDVPLAEPVARALTELVSRGDTGYPSGTAYAEALAAFAAERWDWDGIAVARTTIVPDVMMGIVEVLRLVTEPGDQVVVNNPVYPPFYSFIEHMDRRVLEAPAGPVGRLDLAVLEGAFEQATAGGAGAAYLLCNPHNPLGTVHTQQELEAVAAMAERHGVRVVADEIHGPLVLPGARFVPYLSVPGAERGFSLMSASKGWNLAGLKAAVAVAGAEAGADLARMPEEVSHGPSHVGVVAHTAALREGGPWLDALLAGLAGNRRLLGDLVAEHLPTIGHRSPEATFLAWLDCRALGLAEDGADGRGNVMTRSGPAAFFLQHARVALNAGSAFGTGGAGHCRLNYGTSQTILTEAVGRMADAVSKA